MKVLHLLAKHICSSDIFWKYKPPQGAAGDETLASNHLELNLVSRFFVGGKSCFLLIAGKFEDRKKKLEFSRAGAKRKVLLHSVMK